MTSASQLLPGQQGQAVAGGVAASFQGQGIGAFELIVDFDLPTDVTVGRFPNIYHHVGILSIDPRMAFISFQRHPGQNMASGGSLLDPVPNRSC